MYKEFDSIFHEETIVHEDKSDIELQYARRKAKAREASENGHNKNEPSPSEIAKHSKHGSKSEYGSAAGYDSFRHRKNNIQNYKKGENNSIKQTASSKRDADSRNKHFTKAANESSLFLDFDLI